LTNDNVSADDELIVKTPSEDNGRKVEERGFRSRGHGFSDDDAAEIGSVCQISVGIGCSKRELHCESESWALSVNRKWRKRRVKVEGQKRVHVGINDPRPRNEVIDLNHKWLTSNVRPRQIVVSIIAKGGRSC
jgi:hypothetical protein